MLQWRLVFVTTMVIGSVLASDSDQEVERVKKQSTFSTTTTISYRTSIAANGATTLINPADDQPLVALTGSDAKKTDVGGSESVRFSGSEVVVLGSGGSITNTFGNTRNYATTAANGATTRYTQSRTDSGAGALYTSTNRALFVQAPAAVNAIDNIIRNAPPIEPIEVATRVQGSDEKAVLTVNGQDFLTATGAPTEKIGTNGEVRYSGNTITTSSGQSYSNIIQLGAYRFVQGNTGNRQYTSFNASSNEVFNGPGQLFVNSAESKGLYIEDFSFRSGGSFRNILPGINNAIVSNTIRFQKGDGTTTVTNNRGTPVTTLTPRTIVKSYSAPTTVSYNGPGQSLTITDGAGRIETTSNVRLFSDFRNNDLTTYPSVTTTTNTFKSGGSLFLDANQGSAIFTSNSNPQVANAIRQQIPENTETFRYNIRPNFKNVQVLSVTRRNVSSGATKTEPIQTVTGAYTTRVGNLQSVTYSNNVARVVNSVGQPVQTLENVDKLVVNTGGIPFETFNGSSSFPINGPGTLSYNRGTAFFTSDPTLGDNIVTTSLTAPVPTVEFEGRVLENVTIDDVNTTRKDAIVKIGGDNVVSFEGTSFQTRPDQEILYSGGKVSVYRRPIRATNVRYNSNTGTGSYTNSTQSNVPLSGVTSFKVYTGGSVREITTPNNFTSSGPGNLYISDDGSKVLFTTSNVITTELANTIRETVPIDTTINADRFSAVVDGIYTSSTDQATVLYPGGNIIYSSNLNGTNLALYTDEEINTEIFRTVPSILGVTKTLPATNGGTINIIFNGRVIYSYTPVQSNRQVLVGSTGNFEFNGTALVGDDLPNGPYTGINNVIFFDGIETKEFNSSDAPKEFRGPGLLLTKFDSDTAFYTTSPSAIQFISAAIENQRRFLVSPELQAPQEKKVSTKQRSGTFSFGQDVTAFQGADITLRCNVARANPAPTISFFRGNITLNGTTQEEIISNDTLTLTNIAASDSGDYSCDASNGVPPPDSLSTKLTVRNAVAPKLIPLWFPRTLQVKPNQKLFWPNGVQGNKGDVDVQVVDQLLFACRVEGRPKALVNWTLNGNSVDMIPYASVNETKQGRSLLTLDISNDAEKTTFSTTTNNIRCFASNAGGSTEGNIQIIGSSFTCSEASRSNCSTTCGFGIEKITYQCTVVKSDATTATTVAPSTVPPGIPNPPSPEFDRCTTSDARGNTIICPVIEFEWNTTEWSGCSKSCGGGERTREASCLRLEIPVTARYLADINNTRITGVVNDSMCVMFTKAGARPTEREVCNREQCPIWRAGAFSQCSVTCGEGTSMRDVECNMIGNRSVDMNGKVEVDLTPVNDSFCNDSKKPKDTRQCNTFRCFFEWRPGAYGKCGDIPIAAAEFASCKYREVFCYNYDSNLPSGTSRRVDDSFCDGLQQLLALTHCKGTCLFGIWDAGPWSNCSKDCAYGIQTRSIQCLSPKSFTPVPLNYCVPKMTPATTRGCFVQNCPGMCQRDESTICPILANLNMCNMNVTMGLSGMRCCTSCMGMGGAD